MVGNITLKKKREVGLCFKSRRASVCRTKGGDTGAYRVTFWVLNNKGRERKNIFFCFLLL